MEGGSAAFRGRANARLPPEVTVCLFVRAYLHPRAYGCMVFACVRVSMHAGVPLFSCKLAYRQTDTDCVCGVCVARLCVLSASSGKSHPVRQESAVQDHG
jgi:hypothetical protein